MADIKKTITIKSNHAAEMIEIFGEWYQTDLPDEKGGTKKNPESKEKFAGRMFDEAIARHIHEIVISYRRRKQLEGVVADSILVEPTTTTTTAAPTPTTTTVAPTTTTTTIT